MIVSCYLVFSRDTHLIMGKYKSKYKEEWKQMFPALQKCDSEYALFCIHCKKKVSFEHGGKNDLAKHTKGDLHQKYEKQAAGRKMTNFYPSSCKCNF